MAVANSEILKAVAEFVLDDGTIVQNILHFIANFAGSQPGSLVLAAIQSYVEDLYASIVGYIDQNVSTELCTVHVIQWNPATSQWETQRLIGNTLPAITFTATTDPYPNQVAAVIVGNTERPKSRGRKFMVPFVEAAGVGSELIAAAVTALGTTLSHYLADETVAGADVLSPGVPRTAADEFLEFTDGVVNSILGSQRRRKPGVGA